MRPSRTTALALLLAAGLLALPGCAGFGASAREKKYDEDRRMQAHYAVAMDHLREGRSALAIRELRAAQQLAPDNPQVHVGLAQAYQMRRGHRAEAEKHLRRALEIDPNLQIARLNLSAWLVGEEHYEEAIEHTRKLADDPTFPAPWKALANQGWAEYKLGRLAEARASLELALDYQPLFWPARLSLAVLDFDQGRRLEAMHNLEKVLEIDPGPLARAEAHYRLAEVYISLGNHNKAVHHLSAARDTRPSGQWGKRSQDYLERLR